DVITTGSQRDRSSDEVFGAQPDFMHVRRCSAHKRIMRREIRLLIGCQGTDNDFLSVAERDFAGSDAANGGRQATVDFEANCQYSERHLLLRRPEINRMKAHFIKVSSPKPPVPRQLMLQTSDQRHLRIYAAEILHCRMERHHFTGWIREKKKVASRYSGEIFRSVLYRWFGVGGHQRLGRWQVRRDFSRLGQHSLPLLGEVFKSNKRTIDQLRNILPGVAVQVELNDQ